MIPVFSFIGKSNSGKTTLLEKIVKELKVRGYRVAVVKHTHHGFDMDHPGKDSCRFTQAGSDIIVLSSPYKVAFSERLDTELTLGEISTLFKDKVDIVLTEGYKNGDAAKILVLPTGQGKERLFREERPLATVSARLSSLGIPQFNDDDVALVIDLLIDQIAKDSSDNIADTINDLIPGYDSSRSSELEELLAESASVHGHICPGQVLGVRMAMRGCQELGIEKPKEEHKRMMVYVEIDRCATDAIQTVTGCKLGKRTMKYVDYGKLAATFVDLLTGNAVRLAVPEDVRDKAALYRYQGQTKHDAEVVAYKALPDEELFKIERVLVQIPAEDMPGPPQRRVICSQCGEGVNDGRDVILTGKILCRSCAYGSYYQRYDALVEECYLAVP
ncbi:molybdopterin-guanine dinucleotide biosynthesis protein B [Chloroflexota bacterium]